MNTDDKQLMSRLKAGDERAMAELLERHWAGLVRYAYGLLGDLGGAEDVAQEACVRLWANRDRWAEGSSAVLLFQITRNAALEALRSPRYVAGSDPSDVLIARRAPKADTELAELEAAVTQAVEALPSRRREVFRLVRECGFSYSEIAEVTHLSRRSVASHMSLALSDLRVMLRAVLPRLRGNEGTAASDYAASGEVSKVHSEAQRVGR